MPTLAEHPTPIGVPTAAASPAIAALSGVTKRYANGVTALDGLSLSLKAGEIVALLGPNGAGKSTAVRLLLGLSTPNSGSVRIFGADPRHPATRLRTGAMLQVGRAPEMLRVREHLDIFRGYYTHPLPEAELIRLAGLDGLEERMFGELSGGQKQRVLFALALAGDPDLVFLDEPTVGLDIEARRSLWAAIRSLAARGKTVLLTTHYLEEADALAHRIVVINHGRVICEGTPAEVKAQAAGLTSTAPPGSTQDSTQGAALSGNASQPLAAVRIVRVQTSLDEPALSSLIGVHRVLFDAAGHALLTTASAAATLRELLTLDPAIVDLEVTAPALEDAFLALTAKQ
jgi:ABC-2 type transport system ATP-binding protein